MSNKLLLPANSMPPLRLRTSRWVRLPGRLPLPLHHHVPIVRTSSRPGHAPRRLFWRGAWRAKSSPSPSPSSSQARGDGRPGMGFEWYYIPVGLGIAFLGAMRVYKISTQSSPSPTSEEGQSNDGGKQHGRLQGPWQVRVMSTLPLKAISRLWGRFNELDIPYPLRVPGFRLYSFLFGVKSVSPP